MKIRDLQTRCPLTRQMIIWLLNDAGCHNHLGPPADEQQVDMDWPTMYIIEALLNNLPNHGDGTDIDGPIATIMIGEQDEAMAILYDSYDKKHGLWQKEGAWLHYQLDWLYASLVDNVSREEYKYRALAPIGAFEINDHRKER